MIRIANAPCSWGVLEFDLQAEAAGYTQVLTEMKESGYEGTELGDWGFMPTDPAILRKELESYELELLGAFVPVFLKDRNKHKTGIEVAVRTAGLMAEAGYPDAFIILADENGSIPVRTKNAGRISSDMSLNEMEWKVFAEGANEIAAAVKKETGLRTAFHHHCAGYVETPEEIQMLLSLTDPELVGLVLDTGHYRFGGGDPLLALKKYSNRIWHVHFKDFDPEVAKKSKELNYDYFTSVREGIFCELGKGAIQFPAIVQELKNQKYSGWIVVEQDVLPGMGTPKICAVNNREYLKALGLNSI